MSLLNDMLTDLDAAKKAKLASGPNRGGEESLLPTKPTKASQWILPGIAAVAIAYWVLVEWNVFGWMPETNKSQPAQELDVSDDWSTRLKERLAKEQAAKNSEPETLAIVGDGTINALSSVNHSGGGSNPGARELTDAQMSTMGKRLMQANELLREPSSPLVNLQSALTAYQEVLTMDAQNVVALEGVDKIQQRLLHVMDQARSQSDFPGLSDAYAISQQASVDPNVLTEYAQALEAMNEASKAQQARSLSIKRQFNDQKTAAEITRYKVEPYEAQVIRQLKQGSQAPLSVVALTKKYYAQGLWAKIQTLENAVPSTSNLKKFVHAHRLAGQDNLVDAVAVLSEVRLRADIEHERVRQLAGFLQALKEIDGANVLYQQLTRSRYATVDDWLGLAVTYDAQGRTQAALKAYHVVSKNGHYNEQISSYVQARLRAL